MFIKTILKGCVSLYSKEMHRFIEDDYYRIKLKKRRNKIFNFVSSTEIYFTSRSAICIGVHGNVLVTRPDPKACETT